MKAETFPVLPSTIGKKIKLKHPDDSRQNAKVIDEIRIEQIDYANKIILLQRMKFEDDGKPDEIRVCYYIIGKKPKMLGKWVFGQYATMIPLPDFRKLIRLAEEKKWF
jgi:hypothetical protein